MPPKKKKHQDDEGDLPLTVAPAAAKSARGQTKQRAVVEDPLTFVRQALIPAFHKAQQSTGSHATQLKAVLRVLEEYPAEATAILAAICVKTLTMQQSPDVTKRHTLFLSDVCRTLVSQKKGDSVAAAILAAVIRYHGAKDKGVRFAVCALMEPLLKTLEPDVSTDARNALYDTIVDAMKQRSLDVYAPVRERAIAALAIFQEGTKDCDATQHILVASAEDVNAAVRRVAAAVAMPKQVYFPAVARMTRDVAPTVRKAAWDSLAKYKYMHVVAFCQMTKLQFLDLLYGGIQDTSVPVQLATHQALTKWFNRDAKGDAVAMLSKIALPATESPSVEALARALYAVATKSKGSSAGAKPAVRQESPSGNVGVEPKEALDTAAAPTSGVFPLVLDSLSPANVVMWRVGCEAVVASGSTTTALPTLTEFSVILRDAIDTFIAGDKAETRVARFANPDTADHILRILLQMFPIYDDSGHMAHTDDQVRASLVKNLASLLKVVTDSDPGLFATDTMRALRIVAVRHAALVDATVNDVLQMLFRSLTLPRLYELGFEDVEMFGRRDAERRQELRALQQNRTQATEARYQALFESIETDTLYLLRMLHVVNEYLSFCSRSDLVPPFCSSFIQLGRAQCDPHARALAIHAMGKQCLMSPQTVHTFLPLILSDVVPPSDGITRLEHSLTTEAALTVVFDLLTEYPAAFFASGDGLSYRATVAADADMQRGRDDEDTDETRQHRRDAAIAAIAAEDGGKMGRGALLAACREALLGCDPTLRRVACRGFAKLFACGRLSGPQAVEYAALVLVGVFTFEAAVPQHGRRASVSDVVGAYLYREMDYFFTSFASSDAGRMRLVAEAGALALQLIVTRQVQATPPFPAARLLRRLVFYTDAAILQAVREVDPDFAQETVDDHEAAQRAAAAAASGAVDADADASSKRMSRGSARNASALSVASRSRGAARLMRLLTRHSTHEYLAERLLQIVINDPTNPGACKLVAAELPRLKLYGRGAGVCARLASMADLVGSSTGANASTEQQLYAAFAASLRTADGDDDSKTAEEDDEQDEGALSVAGGVKPFAKKSDTRTSTGAESGGRPSVAILAEAQKAGGVAEALLLGIGTHLIGEGSLTRLPPPPSSSVHTRPASSAITNTNNPTKAHRAEGPDGSAQPLRANVDPAASEEDDDNTPVVAERLPPKSRARRRG